MLENIQQHIQKELPFLQHQKCLVAISGGLDSVVLTRALHEFGFSLALAHCNFKLRTKESDADEEFVKTLATTLDVVIYTKKFDTEAVAEKNKVSIQMAARNLRYEWFQELAETHNYAYILTAHHADDALETFLINLSRGTGIDGLKGIPQQNDNIIRPLLPFSRKELENIAITQKWSWREDSSNASVKYLRNKIRHEIVPKLKELHPTFLQNFQNTQKHLQATKCIINDTILQFKPEAFIQTAYGYKISLESLKVLGNPSALLYESLKSYGFTAWNDLKELIEGQSGKQILSPTHRLVKDRKYLLLEKLAQPHKSNFEYFIDEQTTYLKSPIALQIEEVGNITNKGKSVFYVEKSKIAFPLTLRRWEHGDYFYPSGMQGKKKLSKYFKDEKYSLLDKEQQWLLCNQQQIMWIIGKRSDNRYKITEPTETLLKFTLQEPEYENCN